MLEIGWSEILVIAVVAIVVFPSKDLPRLLRTVGQTVGRLRRMAGDFQSQFNQALREAEREVDLEETRKQIEGLKEANPLSDVKKALDPLRTAGDEIRRGLMGDGAKPMADPRPPAGAVAVPNETPAKTGPLPETPGEAQPGAADVPSGSAERPSGSAASAPPPAPETAPAATPTEGSDR